jgi:hypothetical protein
MYKKPRILYSFWQITMEFLFSLEPESACNGVCYEIISKREVLSFGVPHYLTFLHYSNNHDIIENEFTYVSLLPTIYNNCNLFVTNSLTIIVHE